MWFLFPKAGGAGALRPCPGPWDPFARPVPVCFPLCRSICSSLEGSLHFSSRDDYSVWGEGVVRPEQTQFLFLTITCPPSHWRPRAALIPTDVAFCRETLCRPPALQRRGLLLRPSNLSLTTWLALAKETPAKVMQGDTWKALTLWDSLSLSALENPMSTTRWLRPGLPVAGNRQTCEWSHWKPGGHSVCMSPVHPLLSHHSWTQPNSPARSVLRGAGAWGMVIVSNH